MKVLVALLALVGFVQAVEVTPFSELSVHNLTLTRCPAGTDNETYVRYCGRTGTEIVSPLEEHEAPSYGNFIGQVFEWEAPHSLTWTKKDDSPVNFTIRIGRYYMVKGMFGPR